MTDLLCITVSRDRPLFMPWLEANFNALQWPWGRKHLMVFVDGDVAPYQEQVKTSCEYISFHGGFTVSSLGEHRQHALEVACSKAQYDEGLYRTWITWMDDDDWRYPEATKLAFQSAQNLIYNNHIQAVIPRCNRNLLIEVSTGRWVETPKQIHWYETLVRGDLAIELEAFMPVNISEDYYWHQNVVTLAKSKGTRASHTVSWNQGAYCSANLFHGDNTACKQFEQIWNTAPRRSENLAQLKEFPLSDLIALRMRLNARSRAISS